MDDRDERGVLRRDALDDAGHHRDVSVGRFRDNPLWWTKRVVTVHPLGGAPMGRHVHEGVVDSWGESFGHPGLYVVDGSAVPGPVGPNPSLTIAAMRTAPSSTCSRSRGVGAHRSRAAARGRRPEASCDGPDSGRGMEFTEKMKGYIALGETDPMTGWNVGRQLTPALHVQAHDHGSGRRALRRRQGDHTAVAEGYVECDLLGGELPVQRGWANLFVADRRRADSTRCDTACGSRSCPVRR